MRVTERDAGRVKLSEDIYRLQIQLSRDSVYDLIGQKGTMMLLLIRHELAERRRELEEEEKKVAPGNLIPRICEALRERSEEEG